MSPVVTDPVASRPSPVASAVEVIENSGGKIVTSAFISPQEQVFAGHYPGFPIFPGVCVVECVLHSARQVLPEPGLRLTVVESTRFQSPVFPGDTLTMELAWSPRGSARRCQAEVRTARGPAAQVRLRYEIEEA
jgi:3-hydroxyacyl-[acyl-carrier-protein] dehydratase